MTTAPRQERLLRERDEVDLSELRLVGWCRRCYPDGAEPPVMLLSPRGVAHHVSEIDTTDCGKNATGAGWWWRL